MLMVAEQAQGVTPPMVVVHGVYELEPGLVGTSLPNDEKGKRDLPRAAVAVNLVVGRGTMFHESVSAVQRLRETWAGGDARGDAARLERTALFPAANTTDKSGVVGSWAIVDEGKLGRSAGSK